MRAQEKRNDNKQADSETNIAHRAKERRDSDYNGYKRLADSVYLRSRENENKNQTKEKKKEE